MLPSRHILASLPLGLTLWFFSKSLFAGILCFLSGILVDIDHVIEYLVHFGAKNLNFKEIYYSCKKFIKPKEEGGVEKLYLIFHAGEIAILLWIIFAFSKNIFFFSIAVGYTGHMILDVLNNNEIQPIAYFLVWRLKNHFKRVKIVKVR